MSRSATIPTAPSKRRKPHGGPAQVCWMARIMGLWIGYIWYTPENGGSSVSLGRANPRTGLKIALLRPKKKKVFCNFADLRHENRCVVIRSPVATVTTRTMNSKGFGLLMLGMAMVRIEVVRGKNTSMIMDSIAHPIHWKQVIKTPSGFCNTIGPLYYICGAPVAVHTDQRPCKAGWAQVWMILWQIHSNSTVPHLQLIDGSTDPARDTSSAQVHLEKHGCPQLPRPSAPPGFGHRWIRLRDALGLSI